MSNPSVKNVIALLNAVTTQLTTGKAPLPSEEYKALVTECGSVVPLHSKTAINKAIKEAAAEGRRPQGGIVSDFYKEVGCSKEAKANTNAGKLYAAAIAHCKAVKESTQEAWEKVIAERKAARDAAKPAKPASKSDKPFNYARHYAIKRAMANRAA